MRSNPILFVLILVRVLLNQNFIGNDEGGSCRAVVSGRRYNKALSTTQAETQRAKATHLTSVICFLYSETSGGRDEDPSTCMGTSDQR
jgi:hypothetical protein